MWNGRRRHNRRGHKNDRLVHVGRHGVRRCRRRSGGRAGAWRARRSISRLLSSRSNADAGLELPLLLLFLSSSSPGGVRARCRAHGPLSSRPSVWLPFLFSSFFVCHSKRKKKKKSKKCSCGRLSVSRRGGRWRIGGAPTNRERTDDGEIGYGAKKIVWFRRRVPWDGRRPPTATESQPHHGSDEKRGTHRGLDDCPGARFLA